MARTNRSARQAGARFERTVADYLATALEDDRVDRRVKRGVNDRGDISGVRAHNQRVVIETKDCTRLELSKWIRESHLEAGNDDALVGVLVTKRRGVGDPARQYVHMELKDLVALLIGESQEGCYE